MIVADTSAVIEALLGRPPNEELRRRFAEAEVIDAPHLLDIEFLHALRRVVLAGRLSADGGQSALIAFSRLRLRRHPHWPFADRIWDLRQNLSAYDASFVALAEALEMPLVTCDRRLAAARGNAAEIELYAPPP